MVAAAMEGKRLGLWNKSLFVVPNHIIEQFASEFLQLYPSANILVTSKKDFAMNNRKKFCSKISTGQYDAIIMDPPSYGRGAKGEVWQFENNIYDLVELCKNVLSDNPLFFLINSYTTGISSKVLEDILNLTVAKKYRGKLESGEIGIPMENSSLVLPCGIYGRWEI